MKAHNRCFPRKRLRPTEKKKLAIPDVPELREIELIIIMDSVINLCLKNLTTKAMGKIMEKSFLLKTKNHTSRE